MNQSPHPKRAGRQARSGLSKVEPDFTEEYPGANALASETFVNLVRVGDQMDSEVSRRLRADAGISLRGFALLATIDGLGGSATSAEISSHIAITTAAITSLVDTCEKHGWVTRVPDVSDRRKIQIELTDLGRDLLDRLLPGVHQLEAQVLRVLSNAEMRTLLELLARVQEAVVAAEQQPPSFVPADRHRPARLDPQTS